MLWFHLASHLHLSVRRTKAETSSTEFVKWQEYFKQEPNFFQKQDYYLARIAFEIVRMNVDKKYAGKVKFEDFIIDFSGKKIKKDERTWQEKMKASKLYMFRKLGMSTKGIV